MKGEFSMSQIVVWPGTIVGEDRSGEFEDWVAENGFNVTYLEEFKTLPDTDDDGCVIENTGGRNDLLFQVEDDDLGKFAIWRLGYGMSWWEDYLDNGNYTIVPKSILERYPYGWDDTPDKYSGVFVG